MLKNLSQEPKKKLRKMRANTALILFKNMKLRELKNGEYFTRKNVEYPKENQVWKKCDYDRQLKKYSCINFADISKEIFLKPDTEIFTEFIF